MYYLYLLKWVQWVTLSIQTFPAVPFVNTLAVNPALAQPLIFPQAIFNSLISGNVQYAFLQLSESPFY